MRTRNERSLYGSLKRVQRVVDWLDLPQLDFGEIIPMARVSDVKGDVFDIHVARQEHRLTAGDGFSIHLNTEHGTDCREAGISIDVFSPQRQDFVEE